MRQKFTLLTKMMLLLCALVAGSGSVWADEVVETLTIKGWGNYTTNSYSNADNDYTGIGGMTGVTYAMRVFNGQNGMPRGNQSSASSNFSCRNTNTYSGYYIKQLKIIKGSNSGTFDGSTNGRSVVYFGASAFTTSPTGTATSSEEKASAQSSLTWVNTDKTMTYFILYNLKTSGTLENCTIQITWASASTEPSVDAEDVAIECDATFGEILYTLNNPDGSSVIAAEKSPGHEWIDNVTVDSENSKVTFTATANTGAERTGYITLSYGSMSKDVKVTQKEYIAKYNVNVSSLTNGTVVSDVAYAAAGTTVTLTITPSSGYKLVTITATDADEGVVVLSGSGNTRTFTMPAKDVNIDATFERDYSITYNFAFDSMGSTGWGGGYGEHTQELAGATVYFSYASKQSGTITDIPVLKGSGTLGTRYVSVTPTDANATLKSASFALRHWTNKTITITMYYSTDGGMNWTTTDQTYAFTSSTNGEDVTLTASTLPLGTNAVKLEGSADQQYGVASVSVEIDSKVSIASACTDGEGNYYGTFSNDLSFIVPSGLTVSTISVADGKLVVTDYAEGDIVKAKTGVMVSATSAGDKTVKLSSVTGIEKAGNMLKASGNAGFTAAEMSAADESCKYYRLTMHNGTDIGFWWGAAEGAAFEIAANKAYLAVPSTNGGSRTGFSLFGDESTGINSVESTEQGDVPVYNLQGQRVSKAGKGLYIVNGKKFINK